MRNTTIVMTMTIMMMITDEDDETFSAYQRQQHNNRVSHDTPQRALSREVMMKMRIKKICSKDTYSKCYTDYCASSDEPNCGGHCTLAKPLEHSVQVGDPYIHI